MHREVNAKARCESCDKQSDYLVSACIGLKSPVEDRMYTYHIGYAPTCPNCEAPDPRYLTYSGYCNACDPVVKRAGVVCPSCANTKQHYCGKCLRPIESRNESMMCVHCTEAEKFTPVKLTERHSRNRMCVTCSKMGPVNEAGKCETCFIKANVNALYFGGMNGDKCKTCDEPATKEGYCEHCSQSTVDCLKCRNPVIKPGNMCGDHRYTCIACRQPYDPDEMDQLTCKNCVQYSKAERRCAKCDSELDVEAQYTASGVCDECYESSVDSLVCRRCGITKGYEICPDCYPEKFPCMVCEKNMVHAAIFMCVECENKRYDERRNTGGGLWGLD